MFEELTVFNHLGKFIVTDKKVIVAIYLAAPSRTGRVAYRNRGIRIRSQGSVDDGGFACSGWSGY
jgi:DNA-directed RNA polymerase subunit L